MLLRSFESFEKTENGYLIHGDAADVKLIFMTDDIIRVRSRTSAPASPRWMCPAPRMRSA